MRSVPWGCLVCLVPRGRDLHPLRVRLPHQGDRIVSIVQGMPDHVYHARTELSSTEARLLLEDGGPARYRWAKDNPPLIPPSQKFDVGSAVHAKVLGTGADVVIVDAPDWRTTAARTARDEARTAGKVPLLALEHDEINAMAEAVLANPTARALFTQPGHSEVSVFATDPSTGVTVRGRFDYLPDLTLDRPVAVDLKTTAGKASPDEFGRSCASYGYDTQQEWYLHALHHAGEPGNTPGFVFVAVEKTAPYLVGVFQIPEQLRDRGRRRGARARELFAECAATDRWPGVTGDVRFVDVPNWVIYEGDAA